jgi:hypothetical protein
MLVIVQFLAIFSPVQYTLDFSLAMGRNSFFAVVISSGKSFQTFTSTPTIPASYSILLIHRNEGNIRGVALRAEPKTNVVLVKCKFRANVAGSLGTIFNRGTMTIDRCEFSENSGRVSHLKVSGTIQRILSYSLNAFLALQREAQLDQRVTQKQF